MSSQRVSAIGRLDIEHRAGRSRLVTCIAGGVTTLGGWRSGLETEIIPPRA
ncbi:hypothetical protein [Aminobacter sp. HY435]|uniref:hypothetical protein n=1 Tax=Aminobacter sp. HY435 TaxID=2970917 RepID=UPI0022B98121|nr:hypothetical protein [Aminobacter sp. HY435]